MSHPDPKSGSQNVLWAMVVVPHIAACHLPPSMAIVALRESVRQRDLFTLSPTHTTKRNTP